MNCALCDGIQSTLISREDCKSGKELNVFLCNRCGLIQQLPLPSSDELKRYYATEYRMDYKRTYHPKPKHIYRSARLALRRARFLHSFGITGGRLLDIGAGSGEFVAICNRSGFHAEGAEPNVGYSEYARTQYGANVHTRELAELNGDYDLITMFHVLEHLPSPREIFGQLHGLLKPGGKLLIEVPWGASPSISPSNRYFKAHLYYFEAETLASCASSHFEVISSNQDGNLLILFRRRDEIIPPAMPCPAYADRARLSVSRHGWWSYLITGRGFRMPWVKIKRLREERRVRGLAGVAVLDLVLRDSGT